MLSNPFFVRLKLLLPNLVVLWNAWFDTESSHVVSEICYTANNCKRASLLLQWMSWTLTLANFFRVHFTSKVLWYDTYRQNIQPLFKRYYTLDEELGANLRSYLPTLSSTMTTIITISVVLPLFLIFLAPMVIFISSSKKISTKPTVNWSVWTQWLEARSTLC